MEKLFKYSILSTHSVLGTDDVSHAILKYLCKFNYSLQLCVDNVYKLYLYLVNTIIIY